MKIYRNIKNSKKLKSWVGCVLWSLPSKGIKTKKYESLSTQIRTEQVWQNAKILDQWCFAELRQAMGKKYKTMNS